MNFQHLWRTARARLHLQSGAFDLPSIMIGVAVVAILTVGVLAAIFGVIPWSQDKAAQQDLAAVHDAQGVAFAKDGGFRDKNGLVGAKLLPSDVKTVDSLQIETDGKGEKYVGVSTSETGRKFIITSEAPTPKPLTNTDTWPNGDLVDGTAPSPPDDETPPDNPAAVATYNCGPTELVITQAMLDHSEKNQALLDAGKPEDMVPYPGGGWNVIIDVSKVAPSLYGAFLSTDGAFDPETTTNSEGPSAIYGTDGMCLMYGLVDGERHADQGPAEVVVSNGTVIQASYYTHGELNRTDGAAVREFNSDGSPLKESYWISGEMHRSGGPAEITWSSGNTLASEAWYQNGKMHRTDGPASIAYGTDYQARLDKWYLDGEHYRTTSYDLSTGAKYQDEWFNGEERHREDGAAVITYNEGGSVSAEEYYQNNEHHREDGAAIIFYMPSGTKSSESWYLNGDLHRVGGPAQIGYFDNESISSAQWYEHGQLHRLDGPADYMLEEDGSYMVGQERWFIRGEPIHSRDALVQAGGDPANWPEHWG